MQAMLHGVRRVDMVTKEDNRRIAGFTCFVSYPSEGVTGLETDRKFVSDDLAAACAWHPEVGKMVNLDFTPRGRLSSISTVREK